MAENDPYNALDNFDLPRQTTHCRVLVHSHIINNEFDGKIDCSLDCIQCSTGKTIKGGGNASFVLVPRLNYMNYIFPNDWVNIYFDVGDGRGYIRVFFGFVDRIERTITVSTDGNSTTQYVVSCTDFTKAFEKCNIYFNPHIADRPDLVGAFAGTKNLAGAQLRTKGITAYGTPADIVLNLAHLLLGFKAQFLKPKSYPPINSIIKSSRDARKLWAKSRFSQKILSVIGDDTVTDYIKKLKAEADVLADKIKKQKSPGEAATVLFLETMESDLASGLVREGYTMEQAKKIVLSHQGKWTDAAFTTMALGVLLKKAGLPENFVDSTDVETAMAVEATTLTDEESLLDLIDFTFVEYAAIDGSIVSTPIWQAQGTLWSMMMSYSNDIINELFCDLRPLGANHRQQGLQKGEYLNEPDEHGYAQTDIANNTLPVRYAPSIVMREYPFSTIEAIDASEVRVLSTVVGNVEVGAIFSLDPGKPGRKVNILPRALNPYLPADTKGYKHLDVVVISVRDITEEHIGRGDADTCNFIELYSDGFMGKHMKFMSQDFQPIANPVSIVRNGLRVRTYSTRFARFSQKMQNHKGIDDAGTRQIMARWVLMLDHWYQHNIEYLQGSISLRAFPEIRVGYRLDISERNESYYVEGVNHNWKYPEPMTTSLTLSRGQRNDPYPVYVKPETPGFKGMRASWYSRLADYFKQVDPEAVKRALTGAIGSVVEYDEFTGNLTDMPGQNQGSWGDQPDGFVESSTHEWVAKTTTAGTEELEKIIDEMVALQDVRYGGTYEEMKKLREEAKKKVQKKKKSKTGAGKGIKK